MKVILLVALLGCAIVALDAQAQNTGIDKYNIFDLDFGKALRMYLKAYKRISRCGYAPWNLPAMNPLTLDHLAINENNENLKVNGDITHFILQGIEDYTVVEYDYDDATSTLTYDVVYPQITALGEYNISTWALLGGVPFSVAGEGLLNVRFVDARVTGSFSLTPNEQGGLTITNFSLTPYLGNAIYNNWNTLWSVPINNFVNRFQSEATVLLIQEFPTFISDIYRKTYVTSLNAILANTTMTEAIDFLVEASAELNMASCN